MTPSPAPIEAVSQRLASFLQARVDEWGSSGAEATAFVENAASTLSGGKRLRARFCVTGWRAVAEHVALVAQALGAVILGPPEQQRIIRSGSDVSGNRLGETGPSGATFIFVLTLE